MKKIILIASMALLSILAYSQERVVKEVILGDGNTISGYVTTQPDGSYKVETSAGDVFFFSSSEVKVVQEMEINRVLDGVPGEVVVYKRGGSIRFCSNDQKLTQTDFSSLKGWREYRGAKNLRGWGYGLAATGWATAVAGWVYWHTTGDELGGLIAVAGGPTFLIGGITMIIFGNKKLKMIVKGYNNNPGYAFDFGVQQHGVGFAMTF